MESNQKWLIGLIAGAVVLCMCVGVACIAVGGIALFTVSETSNVIESDEPFPFEITEEFEFGEPDPTPVFPERPTPEATAEGSAEDGGDSGGQDQPVEVGAAETLRTLEEEIVPINDPRELAERLGGKQDIPETLETAPPVIRVGDSRKFWVSNTDTNQHRQVDAVLRYATEHLYFWIEDGVRFNEGDLKRLADTFEEEIYPTNREFFGSEWSPGVDNDPRLYVLYARNLGQNIAGYFSSADSLHPEAHEYSNAAEMFMLSADNVDLGDDYIYGTMAHEFQHMIHWYRDRNEESWLNEGFSVLSELLNDYDVGGFDWLYVQDPDIQLTHWPSTPDASPHYGASFLFVTYFLDRFGDEATQAVVNHEENGMDSIDAVLRELEATDPVTGSPIQADDVFADWAVATFLNNPSVEDGRYTYERYPQAPQPDLTERDRDCSQDWQTRTVSQYGIDYIGIDCLDNYTLHLEGAAEVNLLPADAYSGDYAFWSNKGDESDMTLTRTFDFTDVTGPLTLQFNTWYDLETDYDYLYLVASEDGENWEILKTPSGTDQDPSGNSYGWGYNGQTEEWIEERVDISQFAGKEVQLRFEYVTDAAVNGEGFLLDDVRIPEIDYSEDFEQGEGGWEGNGFARVHNRLPQIFRISLIQNGQSVSVDTVILEAGETIEMPLDFEGELEDAVLVVSGVTRFTTQDATYRYRFVR